MLPPNKLACRSEETEGIKNKSNENVSCWVVGVSFLCCQKADLKIFRFQSYEMRNSKNPFFLFPILLKHISQPLCHDMDLDMTRKVSFRFNSLRKEKQNDARDEKLFFFFKPKVGSHRLENIKKFSFSSYACAHSQTHIFHVCPTINDDKWP